MKRKVFLAILGTFVLFLVVSLVVFYFYLLRPAQRVMADLDQVAELQTMNAEVLNTMPFTPPPGDELTLVDIQRFARVQDDIVKALGPSTLTLLQERGARLKGLVMEGDQVATEGTNMREALLAFEGLGPVLAQAKEAQIQGMNREEFSVEEYRWVREHVYAALGFSRPNAYLEDVAARLQKGEKAPEHAEGEMPSTSAPEENQELVAPYSDRADEWFPFLVFGL
jgi:hypothetical protein